MNRGAPMRVRARGAHGRRAGRAPAGCCGGLPRVVTPAKPGLRRSSRACRATGAASHRSLPRPRSQRRRRNRAPEPARALPRSGRARSRAADTAIAGTERRRRHAHRKSRERRHPPRRAACSEPAPTTGKPARRRFARRRRAVGALPLRRHRARQGHRAPRQRGARLAQRWRHYEAQLRVRRARSLRPRMQRSSGPAHAAGPRARALLGQVAQRSRRRTSIATNGRVIFSNNQPEAALRGRRAGPPERRAAARRDAGGRAAEVRGRHERSRCRRPRQARPSPGPSRSRARRRSTCPAARVRRVQARAAAAQGIRPAKVELWLAPGTGLRPCAPASDTAERRLGRPAVVLHRQALSSAA